MRVKPVPAPPEAVDRPFEIRDALPLVPEPEESCCDRLVRRTSVDDAESARDWLTFLRGLGLVAEGPTGYRRTREGDDGGTERDSPGSRTPSGDLGDALLEGVYGAREVRTLLEESEDSLTADEAFERFEAVPRWERHRNPEWETVWRERVGRLLEWLVLVGRAKREGDGYTV